MSFIPNIQIAGFSNFLHYPNNPSELLIKDLEGALLCAEGKDVHASVLQASYCAVDSYVKEIVNSSADIVIVFGQKASAKCVTLERQAKNLINGQTLDVCDFIPDREKIVSEDDLDERLCTSLDLERLEEQLQSTGPIVVSEDAGDYLCNYIYYLLLRSFKGQGKAVLFVHIPFFEEQLEDLEQKNISYNCVLPRDDIALMSQKIISYVVNEKMSNKGRLD